MSPAIVLVVAVADNGVIGKDGGLPWTLSSDLKYFRAVTMNKPIVMGRKTYESIGKPLEGRDNIVITRDAGFKAPGVLVASGFGQALDLARDRARERGAEEIAVIGGAEIFELALPVADRVYLTEVHAKPEGDTFFPGLDKKAWREVSREKHAAGPRDSAGYSFVVLERAK